jgi:Ca-activated chloride channel family protein
MIFSLFIGLQSFSQENQKTRLLFIFDASNSMNGSWQNGKKMPIARKLLSTALDSLRNVDNLELALRVYGHQKSYLGGQDCNDTKLEVPFAKSSTAVDQIVAKLKTIQPKGTTPIAKTLEKCADDFPMCGDCRNIIILITDGIEECGGDPCAMSMALQEKGIVLKPFVIGIGLDVDFKKTFECIGTYYDVSNEDNFKNILKIVISQALNSTTAQVNLLDVKSKPLETNVEMSFYNHHTKNNTNNLVHTINDRGNPDTVKLDPVIQYDLKVHTIPAIKKDSIIIEAGIHNIIALDAAQGDLQLVQPGTSREKIETIVRKQGELKTLHVQQFGEKERYLVGKYDLEILTLPRIYVNGVKVDQSHTTNVEIPAPGLATVLINSPGYGGIYIQNKRGELELVTRLPKSASKKAYSLQPGNYTLIFRTQKAKEAIYTIEKKFTVISGASTSVKLY